MGPFSVKRRPEWLNAGAWRMVPVRWRPHPGRFGSFVWEIEREGGRGRERESRRVRGLQGVTKTL